MQPYRPTPISLGVIESSGELQCLALTDRAGSRCDRDSAQRARRDGERRAAGVSGCGGGDRGSADMSRSGKPTRRHADDRTIGARPRDRLTTHRASAGIRELRGELLRFTGNDTVGARADTDGADSARRDGK